MSVPPRYIADAGPDPIRDRPFVCDDCHQRCKITLVDNRFRSFCCGATVVTARMRDADTA
jgi:hypothetical protein